MRARIRVEGRFEDEQPGTACLWTDQIVCVRTVDWDAGQSFIDLRGGAKFRTYMPSGAIAEMIEKAESVAEEKARAVRHDDLLSRAKALGGLVKGIIAAGRDHDSGAFAPGDDDIEESDGCDDRA